MRLLIGFLFLMFLAGCRQLPTRVFETQERQTRGDADQQSSMTAETVIVDARPAFDYSVAHLNGSIPLRIEDFNQRESKFKGYLDPDHFTLTRRLARLGISPETPVMVVGRGIQGRGEEGRVAWTLKRLGVRNVRFASIDNFSIPLATAEAPPRAPAAMWKPQGDPTLEVSRQEFLQQTMKPRSGPSGVIIMDVRPSEEYLGKVSSPRAPTPPDIGAINVPWQDFFLQNGTANEKIKERLESVGITPERKIFVISQDGIESAAVTMALRELGFSKAANFSGGYLELLSKN
jgi:thiosulfate/3-mercaptopyruvate sulfurtransferase